ncbi:MAG: SusC/RagA family TonB-linked outer membrane protein [Saprospiraceae bacterium]
MLAFLVCGFFSFLSPPLLANTTTTIDNPVKTILGTVADDEGEPLIGATIIVKGTAKGTVTDFNGNFEIDANDDDILVISYTGFATIEVAVDGRERITIELGSDPLLLSEVVVTGYGTTKKENLTGAVAVISAREISAQPITSASQALQGRVSGIWVNQNSGEPGEDGGTLRIRGIGTLNNADPLILVDGIEAPFDNINPNDISSITVLKDAASAAIYGSRAANGVVLVTTKRGKRADGKPTFQYSAYAGSQNPTNLPQLVTNSAEFMRLRNEADINANNPATYSDDIIREYEQIGPNTDWLDAVFNPAMIQQHNLSVSGGGENSNYFLSLGFLDQNSILENATGAERYNVRLNMDTYVTDNFTIGTSLSFAQNHRNLDNIEQDGGVLARAIRQTPNYPAFLGDGSGRYAQRSAGFPELFTPNILAEIASENRDIEDNRFLGSFYAEYEVIPDLKIRGTVAANYQSAESQLFNRRIEMFDWQTNEFISAENGNRRLENQFARSTNLTSWLQASYEKSFGDNNFKFLAGFNQESFEVNSFLAARTELPTNSLPAIATGNPETATNGGGASEWALRSFFGRINYDLANKYLFEANIRRDGSSRFGSENRWATFPSLSAGWVVTREDFLADSDLVDFLKVRASWGQLGNQNIGDFPSAALISFDPAYNFGGAIVGGAAQTTLGNNDIRWETTTQFDIGFNVGILDGRLSAEFDYFIRNTEDILFDQPNPGVTGVREATTRNIAEVRNAGWETFVNWRDNIGDFSYGISVNLTNVESEIVQIDPAVSGEADRVFDGNFIIQRGSPINAIYGLRHTGVFQSQAEIDGAADQSAFGVPAPGDLRFEDVNGDGLVTVDDRVVIGKDNPSWIYGLNLNLGFKGFDIAATLQGVGDAETYGEGELFIPFANNAGLAEFWLDRWTPENPSTTVPRLAFNGGILNNTTNSYFVQDRAYLRLRNVQIGYTFPASMFEENFIGSLRLYANGTNLLTFTDYLGFDPERAERDSDGGSGYPQLRMMTAGVNLTF